ncbi:MAG: class I adenylate-forming enzyme family protein [Cyanobacteriota bacterium]
MHAAPRLQATAKGFTPLLQMLYDSAVHGAGHPAILCGARTVCYGELVDEIERFARGLGSLGVSAGDRVAIVQPNAPEFVTTFFAVTALGAVAVPLNPAFQKEELASCFRDCRVRVIVTHTSHAALCANSVAGWEYDVPIVTTGGTHPEMLSYAALVTAHPAGPLPAQARDVDAVYQYSSGSTGRPKRVPRTHSALVAEATNVVATTELGPSDRIFCAIPLFHTHGQGNCMLAAIRSGASLVILEDPNPFLLQRLRALEVLSRERITVFPGVPFVFRLLADVTDQADLSALRLCYSAGTALPAETQAAFQARFGVAVRQLYGCTEAGAIAINLDPNPASTLASVGLPIQGVHVQIVNEARHPLPADAVGEIAIRTSAMTRGYHGMDDHNREVFQDGFFYTGDLGRVDAAGRLWITGRKRLFIEVAGNKVDPVEVEDVLAGHPMVREAVVVGVPSGVAGEETIKAVVVSEGPVEPKELIRHCQGRLARYKVPLLVEFRDEIPKSPLGKVLRKYLV